MTAKKYPIEKILTASCAPRRRRADSRAAGPDGRTLQPAQQRPRRFGAGGLGGGRRRVQHGLGLCRAARAALHPSSTVRAFPPPPQLAAAVVVVAAAKMGAVM